MYTATTESLKAKAATTASPFLVCGVVFDTAIHVFITKTKSNRLTLYTFRPAEVRLHPFRETEHAINLLPRNSSLRLIQGKCR